MSGLMGSKDPEAEHTCDCPQERMGKYHNGMEARKPKVRLPESRILLKAERDL